MLDPDSPAAGPERLWWQEGVIYQIYPMSFADSDGDGVGDLRGILDRLDYLDDGTPNSLGIDAISLSPIYPSPRRDFGYDVSDYCDVDPVFGSLGDLDELVRAAHKRGVRVIMDLVLNHTSDQHPWFLASRSSRENPMRDWYLWHDGGGPSQPPNNWRSAYGGSAWTWEHETEQWYMHGFLPEQPDLNWRNPLVRQALLDVARFWLDRGIDGFRLAAVNHYYKDAQFRDNPPGPRFALNPYDRQQHVYDKDQPELIGTLCELRGILDGYPARVSVGEVSSDHPTLMSAALYGPNNDALQMALNKAFGQCKWDPAAFQKVILDWEKELPPGGWPCFFLSNHDIIRHFTRYARGKQTFQRARVAASMLLTLRGTPFLYYGEEIGMFETAIPRSERKDPPGRKYWPLYKGRDGCRTPMQWDDSTNAGFSEGEPWLPVHPGYEACNVALQSQDPQSLLSHYRDLIWLRKATSALRRGDLFWLQEQPADALSFLRRTSDQVVWVLLNFRDHPIRFVPDKPLPSRRWQVLFSTAGKTGVEEPGLAPVFAPYEVCILEAL